MNTEISAWAPGSRTMPRTLDETVAWLAWRAPRYGFISYACEGCGEDAAADNPRELAELAQHAAFEHVTPAGLLGLKSAELTVHPDRLRQMLGGAR